MDECTRAAVWDYDYGMRPDFIGYYEESVAGLLAAARNSGRLHLLPPPKPHKQARGCSMCV
jgi:hypothetical protein